MRFGPTGISVTPAERYEGAAGNRWPMSIMPAPGELLSSWLHRLAYANGIPPHYFGALLGAPGQNWSARLDRAMPDRILQFLGEHTHIPLEDIAALTIAPDPLARLRLPLRASPQQSCAPKTQATWLQFCPTCLAEDETPYFRRGWSLATRVSCFRHGCRLRDRCPSCGGGLAPFSQKRLVPHQICAWCGAALCKRTRPAANGVRRLERLIDDLLRLQASGHRMAEGRSLPDLLGSACFQFSRRPMSIARLSHRDRYQLFWQLTDGQSTPFGTRRSSAIIYWKRVAQVAPAWGGLVTSFSDAVLPRPKAGPCSNTAGPNLADLVQAAARLDQQRQAL